jgi:hypothetical protein
LRFEISNLPFATMLLRPLVRIAFIFLLASVSFAQGEGKCNLKLDQVKPAPELYSFRLGMAIEEVKKLVPTLQTRKADDLGLMKTSFSPRFDPKIDKTQFENVRTISFEFLDDRLMDLWIGYTSEFKWTALEDFIPQMSASLGLPSTNAWRVKGLERRFDCAEFQVAAWMVAGGPSIRLTDATAKQLWEKRRADKAAQEDGP